MEQFAGGEFHFVTAYPGLHTGPSRMPERVQVAIVQFGQRMSAIRVFAYIGVHCRQFLLTIPGQDHGEIAKRNTQLRDGHIGILLPM